jgi:hypothetical protein
MNGYNNPDRGYVETMEALNKKDEKMLNFGESELDEKKVDSRWGRQSPIGEGLFKRVPTDDEKRYYRNQWGGLAPRRVAFGMFVMFFIGCAFGYGLGAHPEKFNLPEKTSASV